MNPDATAIANSIDSPPMDSQGLKSRLTFKLSGAPRRRPAENEAAYRRIRSNAVLGR